MVSINYAFREICCKIVYYGPGLSGKTTNLIYIHKKAPPKTKGELISLATDADRTLYFDFLPLDIGQVQGFSTKFQLYTVPGQLYYNATRKLVLRGVDGLIFVVDSQETKLEENIESMHNLLENLGEYGYDIEELPMVMQYNKRDLDGVSSVEELEMILNHSKSPYFEAVAVQGIGVFDTLKSISKLVLDKAKSRSAPQEKKELVAVGAQSQIYKPAFAKSEDSEINPPPENSPESGAIKVVEKKGYHESESKDEVIKAEESDTRIAKGEEELPKQIKPAEKLEIKDKVEDKEKVKEEDLIQNQKSILKDLLEDKKEMEEKILKLSPEKVSRENIRSSFEEKVMVSPMLKPKKKKSARGGFLWRWFQKITGRR